MPKPIVSRKILALTIMILVQTILSELKFDMSLQMPSRSHEFEIDNYFCLSITNADARVADL